MRPVFRGVLGVCVVLCLAPGSSHADPGAKAEARQHHNLGLASMKHKAYGEAIAELNQAYDLGHDFAVLYDIGQAYIAMEQPVFAVKMLKKYLAEGGKQVSGSRRKEVEATLATQQWRIASVTIRAAVDGVVLRVDGLAVGKTPLPASLELGAGPHFLSASAEGYRTWNQPLELSCGEKRDLDIRLELSEAAPAAPVAVSPLPAAPAAVTVPSPVPSPAPPLLADITAPSSAPSSAPASAGFPTRKIVAYALGGVGIAALAVGSAYGVAALTNRRDSDAACPQNQCSQTGVDLNNQAKTSARVADIGIGVGLVGVAVATYLLLRPAQSEAAPASAAAPGVRLAAGVGPHQAAVALRGSW